MERWSPDRWRGHRALQQPSYPDSAALAAVEARLAKADPVIAVGEARALRTALSDPSRFLLQGGDCAESFDDPVGERVAGLSGLFDALVARLRPALASDPVSVARIAGQFAKPRSADTERRGDESLPAYRGDIINGAAFDASSREADPQRMLRAHLQSVGAAASLHAARCGVAPIFTSHEALLLPYEQALARRDEAGRWWATSGHMLWLGDRTRQADGAHVEFLSGVDNALGVKCGPTLSPDDLLALASRLDPVRTPGRLTLIGRFGAEAIADRLPPLIRAARREGIVARWAIDPMHGNTRVAGGRKLRRLADILAELDAFVAICRAEGVVPGGIHLEMSPLDVTECLGGAGPVSAHELDRNWRTACDPRLNRAQALEVADRLATALAPRRAAVRA